MRAAVPVTLTALIGIACAASPPRDTRLVLLEAARDCANRFQRVRVVDVDRFGQMQFQYLPGADEREAFLGCYRAGVQERLRALISPGRLVVPAGRPGPTHVPIEVHGTAVFVQARINRGEAVTLLVDTGAARTILKPAALAASGIRVPKDAFRLTLRLADDRMIEVPIVRVGSLAIGDITVEDIDIGVYDVLPRAEAVGGLLGTDVLGRLKVGVDVTARQLTLEPNQDALTAPQ